MRWRYIVPRVILLATVWAFFTFGLDPLLERGLVTAGQSAAAAKVDIAGVKTSFFPPAAAVAKVCVANHSKPGTNLVEFDSLEMKFEGGPLLRKLFIVDEGELTGLHWGTSREDSGLLPETPAQQEPPAKDSDAQSSQLESEWAARAKTIFAGLTDRAKSTVDPQQFESVRLGQDMSKRWTASFNSIETRSDGLKQQIDSIKAKANTNSGNKLERLETYRSAASDATRLLQEIKQLKADLDAQKQQARQDFASFKQAREHDMAKIQDAANLLKMDPQQLTEYLLGPELHKQLNAALEWTKWAKAHFLKKPDEPQPNRLGGEEIAFPRTPELPRFLIKSLRVSGAGDVHGQQLQFTGTVTGITSDPVIYGQPVVVQLTGDGAGDLDLRAEFDYTKSGAEPTHHVLISYSAPNPGDSHLGSDDALAITVTPGKLASRTEVMLVGETLHGTLNLKLDPTKLALKTSGKSAQLEQHVTAALADIVAGINAIQADLVLDGPLDNPKWSIKSDLGPQIASGMGQALSHELTAGKQELAAKLDQTLNQQAGQLQNLFKQQSQLLAGKLNLNETELQQIAQQVTGGRLSELEKGLGKPLDALKKPLDPAKPPTATDLKQEEDAVKNSVKSLFRK
jgi:uncharacterized protein (TIGR03545 family)